MRKSGKSYHSNYEFLQRQVSDMSGGNKNIEDYGDKIWRDHLVGILRHWF
jgi:hypothetical protein